MQEDEQQVISENENPEISNSENQTNEETVTDTPASPEIPTATEDNSEGLLLDISLQFAELIEKYDEQIVKKEEKEVATLFITPSGPIAVNHEISLGNLLIATLLFGVLVFNIIARLILRR